MINKHKEKGGPYPLETGEQIVYIMDNKSKNFLRAKVVRQGNSLNFIFKEWLDDNAPKELLNNGNKVEIDELYYGKSIGGGGRKSRRKRKTKKSRKTKRSRKRKKTRRRKHRRVSL